MEVVMPRLSASVNLWEFLLMKTERKSARPDLSEMIKEFEDFRKQIATMFRTKLVPISTDTSSMAASDEQKMDTDKSLDELENLSADYHVKPKAKTTKSIIEVNKTLCYDLILFNGKKLFLVCSCRFVYEHLYRAFQGLFLFRLQTKI